jgi:hypothetical protein
MESPPQIDYETTAGMGMGSPPQINYETAAGMGMVSPPQKIWGEKERLKWGQWPRRYSSKWNGWNGD